MRSRTIPLSAPARGAGQALVNPTGFLPAVAVLLALGCGESREGAADTSAASPPCPGEHGEKLGVPFVRFCAAGAADAVWIAATPLPCSAGEHETLACPIVTPLLVEPPVPAQAPRSALLTDGFAAHRTCAMRFAGRLPTPEERSELRRQQGLVTLIASRADDGSLRIEELDEWTQSGDCTNPSLPGSDCRFTRSTGIGARDVDWRTMQRCRAEGAPDGTAGAIALGERCAPGAECVLRSPWFPTVSAVPRLHRLRCEALADVPVHPDPRPDVAAFRCVLPRGALTPAR